MIVKYYLLLKGKKYIVEKPHTIFGIKGKSLLYQSP